MSRQAGRRRGFDVVVTDLDRTFTTEDLAPAPAALAALDGLRRAGIRCVVATGRRPEELGRVLGPAAEGGFDGYVVEGGALWGRPGRWRLTSDAIAPVLRAADLLQARGVPVRRGRASFSVARPSLGEVRSLAQAAALSMRPNHERVDVTAAGVGKAAGLRRLLESWGMAGARVLAVGDGENDLDLFAACQVGVAVANAAPALKSAADEVAPLPAAEGFAWAVRERVLSSLAGSPP